jgi:hypothetical protein
MQPSDEHSKKNTPPSLQVVHSPKAKSRAGRLEILNDIANFRADKLHHINFARQMPSKDQSPARITQKGQNNQKMLKRYVTTREDQPSSRLKVAESLDLDYQANALRLYNSYNRPPRRSRSEIRGEDMDEFGYDDKQHFQGDKEGILISPEDVHLTKLSRNRYNLRPLKTNQKSSVLDS